MPFASYETPFISFAQAREDVVLVRSLREVLPDQGFYIDVGAFHPHFDSITKTFYDAGWRGINIEPMEHLLEPFLTERTRDINLQAAMSDQTGELTFYKSDNGQLGTLEERYAEQGSARTVVPVRTLSNVCEQYAPDQIHFLKIDVEGHERNVIQGMDFSRFRPWILIIEAVVPNTHIPTHQEWEDMILAQGYEFVLADAINRFYLADEHKQLKPNFSLLADNYHQARDLWNLSAANERISILEKELAVSREANKDFPVRRGLFARIFR